MPPMRFISICLHEYFIGYKIRKIVCRQQKFSNLFRFYFLRSFFFICLPSLYMMGSNRSNHLQRRPAHIHAHRYGLYMRQATSCCAVARAPSSTPFYTFVRIYVSLRYFISAKFLAHIYHFPILFDFIAYYFTLFFSQFRFFHFGSLEKYVDVFFGGGWCQN